MHTLGNESGFKRKMVMLGLNAEHYRILGQVNAREVYMLCVATEREIKQHRDLALVNWRDIPREQRFICQGDMLFEEAEEMVLPILQISRDTHCLRRYVLCVCVFNFLSLTNTGYCVDPESRDTERLC